MSQAPKELLEIRQSGQSDLFASVLAFGCWQFGSTGGADDYWGVNYTQDMANAMVQAAVDRGVTYFDTAEVYNEGKSERQLGEAVRGLPAEQRAKVVIGTKIPPNACTPASIRQHLDESLARLGVEYVDVYMVHWPIDANAMAHFAAHGAIFGDSDHEAIKKVEVPDAKDAFRTLGELQKEGKIKHIGVSNFGVKQLQEALSTGVRIALNEVAYSLLFRAVEFEIIPFCIANGIGIHAYMPLMQGLLTGAYATPNDVPEYRARTRHFNGARPKSRHGEQGHEQLLFETLAEIKKIADEEKLGMDQLALAWPLAQPGVLGVIAGVTKPAQLEANATAASLKLSPQLVARLTAATDALKQAMGGNADLWQGSGKGRIE